MNPFLLNAGLLLAGMEVVRRLRATGADPQEA